MLDRLFTIFQLFVLIVFLFCIVLGIHKVIENQKQSIEKQTKISQQLEDYTNLIQTNLENYGNTIH